MFKPYFHPTTAVVLDDDPNFVESFVYRFSEDIKCKGFTQPAKALEFLKENHAQHSQILGGLSLPKQEEGPFAGNLKAPLLDIPHIIEYSKSPLRFSQVSVVVVDYDMPGMNGLEFCEKIMDMPMRRIMLTGKADHHVAIDAFNDGLIHRFIMKQEETASTKIRIGIDMEQQNFFANLQKPLIESLNERHQSLLKDPNVEKLVDEIIQTLSITEYYLPLAPKGFLLLTEKGQRRFLLLQNQNDLRTQREIAEEEGAPSALLQTLASSTVMALFPTSEGWFSKSVQDWRRYIHTGKLIPGSSWLYALVDPSPF